MNNEKTGKFIATLRKENQMTQKELADKMHITDKAVSKWERGLSYPDITLLSTLADVLGVSTSELLKGEKSEVSQEVETTVDNALIYAEKAVKSTMLSFHNILTISFLLSSLLGIITCSICDFAITGTFTWSLYPISAIIFACIVLIPILKFGKKGILGSLIAVSVSIIPFIYVLSEIIGDNILIMPIGIRMSVISIIYLWVIYLIFKIFKTRKFIALAISLILVIPMSLAINYNLSKFITEKFIDIWDILTFGIVIIAAVVLLIIDYSKKHYNK